MTLQSNQDKDERSDLAYKLGEMYPQGWHAIADFILARDSNLIQAVLGEIEAEIDHKIMVTNIHNIEPLKNGQYIRVDNMRKAIARLKKKYE